MKAKGIEIRKNATGVSVSTTLAVLIWFATAPVGIVLQRRAPAGTEQLFG